MAYESLERYRKAYVDYKTVLQIDTGVQAAHDSVHRSVEMCKPHVEVINHLMWFPGAAAPSHHQFLLINKRRNLVIVGDTDWALCHVIGLFVSVVPAGSQRC